MKLGDRCKHGLYCFCFLCSYENEIQRLKNENEELRKEITQRPKAIETTESA